MSKRKALCRVAAAAVLATLLSGAPAQAIGWEAGPPALFERAWAWIAGWFGGGSETEKGSISHIYQEQGPCIDPNGCPDSASSRTAPQCRGDEGACIDPNG